MEIAKSTLPDYVEEELADYEAQIRKYRAGLLDETKMQKLRLHFGTYAQRQEGVQMQRIKIPGGFLTADQLVSLADAAERFASGFMHFTTREDAQLYYVSLDEAPELLRFLAQAGITTREACGNTVRNITACYRAGTSHNEAFDVGPYAEALFRFLVRNKYNQNLGRKFKITFEGCAEDHSGLRIHDIGFWAVTRETEGGLQRGFRVYLGGGLGGAPHLAHLYSDFLPIEELFGFTASVLRVFDRYGERKSRMKARMKFLVQSLGWEVLVAELEQERERVPGFHLSDYLDGAEGPAIEIIPRTGVLAPLDPRTEEPGFREWVRDSVIEHRYKRYRGVHLRIKLGDITSNRARQLAEVVRRFSAGRLRISIEQNIYLPWVREEELVDLYHAVRELSLADAGAGTFVDVTSCPGSDTCRLGIASAKGLGSAVSEAFEGPLAELEDMARPIRLKISGCPNGCAQHSIANIGFHAAALAHNGRTVPAHLMFIGGQPTADGARFGWIIGKLPAKNCIKAIESILTFYRDTRLDGEDFNSFVARTGEETLKALIEPLRAVPEFEEDPSFYQDYGHENEKFAVRAGVKGECAGATVAETVPTIDVAREWLAQAGALVYHKEYEHAAIAAYEAAAAAARVPLYARLVDPFTSEEALWEFENIFVLSGDTAGAWENISSRFEALRTGRGESEAAGISDSSGAFDEAAARRILSEAEQFVNYCGTGSLPTAPNLSQAKARIMTSYLVHA